MYRSIQILAKLQTEQCPRDEGGHVQQLIFTLLMYHDYTIILTIAKPTCQLTACSFSCISELHSLCSLADQL